MADNRNADSESVFSYNASPNTHEPQPQPPQPPQQKSSAPRGGSPRQATTNFADRQRRSESHPSMATVQVYYEASLKTKDDVRALATLIREGKHSLFNINFSELKELYDVEVYNNAVNFIDGVCFGLGFSCDDNPYSEGFFTIHDVNLDVRRGLYGNRTKIDFN